MTDTFLKAKTTVENPETGIIGRKRLASNLSGLLADTALLTFKTQAVHWNIVGPVFLGLHNLTEIQYRDMFEAVDRIAERIRALGYPAPASAAEMLPLTVIEEISGTPSAEAMIDSLADDHEKISTRLRDIVGAAEEQRDSATADLLTARLHFHEKAVWMLRAVLTS